MTEQMQGVLMSMHFTSSHAYGGQFYLFDHEEEKSLVPPYNIFLAFQTDSVVTFYLESLVCENILLSEKGK